MSQLDNFGNEQHEAIWKASGTVLQNVAIEIFSQLVDDQ